MKRWQQQTYTNVTLFHINVSQSAHGVFFYARTYAKTYIYPYVKKRKCESGLRKSQINI